MTKVISLENQQNSRKIPKMINMIRALHAPRIRICDPLTWKPAA
jgi:hypothetical protein